jgi:hypothetical protein
MRERAGIREIVNGDEFQGGIAEGCPQDISTDTAEAVNTNAHGCSSL